MQIWFVNQSIKTFKGLGLTGLSMALVTTSMV